MVLHSAVENPDVVAEMFGYESGDALIRDLLNSPSPKQKLMNSPMRVWLFNILNFSISKAL